MIKINLATRKQSGAGGAHGGGKTGLTSLTSLTSLTKLNLEDLRELPLARIAMNLVAGVAAYFLLESFMNEKVAEWDETIKKQQARQAQLTTEVSKIAGFEAQLKALEGDESLLRTKLEAIRALVTNRQVAPRMLLAISTGVPKNLWINTLRVGSGEVNLSGFAHASEGTGYDEITDFMESLSKSAFFADLKLVSTQKDKDESGAEVASFDLSAKKR